MSWLHPNLLHTETKNDFAPNKRLNTCFKAATDLAITTPDGNQLTYNSGVLENDIPDATILLGNQDLLNQISNNICGISIAKTNSTQPPFSFDRPSFENPDRFGQIIVARASGFKQFDLLSPRSIDITDLDGVKLTENPEYILFSLPERQLGEYIFELKDTASEGVIKIGDKPSLRSVPEPSLVISLAILGVFGFVTKKN